jgi:serine/threonine protein kinase
MVTGCFAFDHDDKFKLIELIINLKIDYPKFLSDEVKDLIKKILVLDPEQRPSLEDISGI